MGCSRWSNGLQHIWKYIIFWSRHVCCFKRSNINVLSLSEWTDAGGEKTFVHTVPQFFQGFAFGILLSGIIPMLIAGIIGYGILGLRGHYFAICTLALGIAAGEIAGGVEIIGAGQGMTVPVWPKGFGSNNLLSLDNLQEILHSNYGDDVEVLPEYLNEITTEKILIRMLRNLKNSYMESYAYEIAIKCNKMILSLSPDSPDEVRDLGIIENKLLQYDKAVKLLNHYLELEPNANDADFILKLIKESREKITHQ